MGEVAALRPGRRILPMVFGLGCLAASLALAAALFVKRSDSVAAIAGDGTVTGSVGSAPRLTGGATGLPLPRFVSLKSAKTNVRRGPSSGHPIAWVFQSRGMPVEIVAESDNWRRIRDSEGEEGWILQNMLSGKRTALVAPWRKGEAVGLYSGPAGGRLVAKIGAGVIGDVSSCGDGWCSFAAGGQSGYIEQAMLWGVYPDEKVKD